MPLVWLALYHVMPLGDYISAVHVSACRKHVELLSQGAERIRPLEGIVGSEDPARPPALAVFMLNRRHLVTT